MTIEHKKEIRNNRAALIEAHHNNNTPADTVNALIASIGYDAAAEIIAAMVSVKGIWDQRISTKNRAWAAEIAADFLGNDFVYYCDEIHPAHMDQIADAMRNAERPAETNESEPAEETETMATETKTIFPNLTAAVNAHFDSENKKAAADLASVTCKDALDRLWYRECMTPAARRMVEESAGDARIPEAAQKKMLARITRDNEKQRAEYLDKIAAAEAAPDPEYMTINMEWKRSSTWGMNPTVEIVGERTRTGGHASGCGYDKASAATASAANKNPEILRILYKHAENGGKFPYSVYTFAGLPYFDGGCGMSCFYNVFEACGYRFKQTASAKTFDGYAIMKGGADA